MSKVLDVLLWFVIHGLIIVLFLSSALGMPQLLSKQIDKQPKQMMYNQGKMYFWDKAIGAWYLICAGVMFYSLFIPNSFFGFWPQDIKSVPSLCIYSQAKFFCYISSKVLFGSGARRASNHRSWKTNNYLEMLLWLDGKSTFDSRSWLSICRSGTLEEAFSN